MCYAAIMAEETYVLTTHDYFVIGRGLNGSRFISETVHTYGEAERLFDIYMGVVHKIGAGGEVCLYGRKYDDYEVLKSDWTL